MSIGGLQAGQGELADPGKLRALVGLGAHRALMQRKGGAMRFAAFEGGECERQVGVGAWTGD